MAINHHIKSQVFDTSFLGNQQDSHALYIRIKSLYYDAILKVIEDCFDEFDEEDFNLNIDRIELDLGNIRFDEIESEMPIILRSVLMEKLKDFFVHKKGIIKRRKLTLEHEEIVINFLRNGYVEWNNSDFVEEALKDCLQSGSINRILSVIRKDERARNRFLKRISKKEIINLIQLIEPDNKVFIEAFHLHLTNQEFMNKASVRSDVNRSVTLWSIMLNYLVSQRDSIFNATEFVKHVIKTVALKYNISFISLIDYLLIETTSISNGYKNELHRILLHIGDDLKIKISRKGRVSKLKKHNFIEDFFIAFEQRNSFEFLKKYSKSVLSEIIYQHKSRFTEEVLNLSEKSLFFDAIVKYYDRSITDQVTAVLEPLGAGRIFDIHESLFIIQDSEQLMNEASKGFQEIIWKVTMMILSANRGSRFNEKTFFIHLIKETAAHYNLSYQQLMRTMKTACSRLSGSAEDFGHFVSLLDEVYLEEFGYEESLVLVEEQLTNIETNALDELNLFKVLKNKSLYVSVSSWKLRHLIDNFFGAHISSNSWKLLWSYLDQLPQLYKFFTATSNEHFKLMIHKIEADQDTVRAHEVISNVITKLFSPSHKSYLVSLDVELFQLLLINNRKSLNHAELVSLLLLNIMPTLPVSAKLFLRQLKLEKLSTDLKRVIVSNEERITESHDPYFSEDYKSNAVLLLKGIEHDFGILGFSDIVQFVTHIANSDTSLTLTLFTSLNKHEVRSVVKRLTAPLLTLLVEIFEAPLYFHFSNFIRLSTDKLKSESHPKTEELIIEFKKAIIVSTFNKAKFQLAPLVNKLYAIIKNHQADCLFQIPTMTLPLYGNINNHINEIESKVSKELLRFSSSENEEKILLKELIQIEEKIENETVDEPLFIHNAGLVLLHPYLAHLFERAGFFRDGKFKSNRARKEAVLFLNYILLNDANYVEENLTLNKILCGLNVSEIIDFDLEITTELADTASSLLDAFTGHWSSISNSTHDGLRGGWFWREGKLLITEDSFELTVEQKAYDILMDQLPFTLSPVVCSWMKNPLNINWR